MNTNMMPPSSHPPPPHVHQHPTMIGHPRAMLPPGAATGFIGMGSPRPPDLHASFKNPNWPPNAINADTVLDYFCDPGNTFYDMSSCNQQIRMQNIARPLQECLLTMSGIQYELVLAQPPLFVIIKKLRQNINEVAPLAYYYIVNGTVFQAPDLYSVIQSRLVCALDPLKEALNQVRQCARFNVAKGYYWDFNKKDGGTIKSGEKTAEMDDDDVNGRPELARSTAFQRTRVDPLLRWMSEQFPPPVDQQQQPELQPPAPIVEQSDTGPTNAKRPKLS